MPSPDLLLMVGLLVLQQVLHAREKRDLLDRFGKPAPPVMPTGKGLQQNAMATKLAQIEKERQPIL